MCSIENARLSMQHLTPKETARFLRDNPEALFVDCRSDMEYRFVGHPRDAVHVSWNDGPSWEINPHFVDAVKQLAGGTHGRPVVLICRTGERSLDAARALEAALLSRVYTVLHGFEGDVGAEGKRGGVNGWRFDGLPWETSPCDRCAS
jgi:rhodanese-related sulfurtransferase